MYEVYEKDKKSPLIFIFLGTILVISSIFAFFWWQSSGSTDNSNANVTPTPTQGVTVTPSITNTPTTIVTTNTKITLTPTAIVTSTPSTRPTGPVQVKAMYGQGEDPNNPNAPNSYKNFAYYVYRIFATTRTDYENYALEQTVKGPSEKDKTDLYWFNPIVLTGESNCGGKDFILGMDYANNKATFQFCKTLNSAGVGDDARVVTVIKAALEQFLSSDTTKKTVILTKEGNCVGDTSGLNKCKN